MPFIAISGKHGGISSLGQMDSGIQIWMDQLDNITISESGDSARIGGGSLSKKVLDTLWDASKQTGKLAFQSDTTQNRNHLPVSLRDFTVTSCLALFTNVINLQ